MNLLHVLILSLCTIGANCDLPLSHLYYKQLIDEGILNATIYELPTDNSEFNNGFYTKKTIIDFGTFDFIIVGAGSAGCVLAARLSEVAEWKILVLEAGGEENDFTKIPGMLSYSQFSNFNWGYYTTPQKNCCLGMKDQKCVMPRGKAIGGSSAINALAYVRGNKHDFDKWAAMGNPGWAYDDVLPYFIKSENSQIEGDAGYHGKGGFLNVEYVPELTDLVKIFIDGNAELGRPYLDYNGQSQLGVSRIQQNVKHGKRQSSGAAFLDNARKRKNLKIVTRAFVTKIIIDPKQKIAQGVEFVTKNRKYHASATKEVILSAGAINSPILLKTSGCGPKEELEKLDISVVVDLQAIGKNLKDHSLYYGLFFRSNYSRPQWTQGEMITQFMNSYGPLTAPADNQVAGFMGSKKGAPETECILMPSTNINTIIGPRLFNFDLATLTRFVTQLNADTDFLISVVLLHPKSSGQIRLKSADPKDFPEIELNMFSEPEDITTLRKGIEQVLELLQTEAFKKINASFVDVSTCSEFKTLSEKYWDCAIRRLTGTIYHACGTTRMGPNKTSSVVDKNLKVHGVNNLRVVDAGVMPSTVSGHINAAVVMIAEKASDIIKQLYGKPIEKCS